MQSLMLRPVMVMQKDNDGYRQCLEQGTNSI